MNGPPQASFSAVGKEAIIVLTAILFMWSIAGIFIYILGQAPTYNIREEKCHLNFKQHLFLGAIGGPLVWLFYVGKIFIAFIQFIVSKLQ